jgi:hypothetical protein
VSGLDPLASSAERGAYEAVQRCRAEGYADGYVRALQEVQRHLPAVDQGPHTTALAVANVREWIDRTLRGAGAGRPHGTAPVHHHPDEPTDEQLDRAMAAFERDSFIPRSMYRDLVKAALRAAIHGDDG